MHTFKNRFIAAFVALALIVGVAGIAPAVQAENDSQTVAALSSNEILIKLLQELIEVLKAQLVALSSGADVEDNEESEDAGLSELEATIYLNETLIKVELDDEKDILTTDADTRAEIIEAVLAEYDQLTEEEVDEALEIEEEDRNSRDSDLDWADEDEDDDGEDDDEDEEDAEDEDEEEDD